MGGGPPVGGPPVGGPTPGAPTSDGPPVRSGDGTQPGDPGTRDSITGSAGADLPARIASALAPLTHLADRDVIEHPAAFDAVYRELAALLSSGR